VVLRRRKDVARDFLSLRTLEFYCESELIVPRISRCRIVIYVPSTDFRKFEIR